LLRSDGTPTYMLAVVVDDHDMAITHVIRGDDHLTNAARQKQIYDALGWPVPIMAHIPLIHGPDGSKLSKRHGALGIDAYRAMGYLPAALRNYLVRLGWSHGDQEIFSTEEMIAAFDLPQIGRSPARDNKPLGSEGFSNSCPTVSSNTSAIRCNALIEGTARPFSILEIMLSEQSAASARSFRRRPFAILPWRSRTPRYSL